MAITHAIAHAQPGTHAPPPVVIPAPGAGITDPYRVVGVVSNGPRRPMVGVRGSGADATPCRQHGGQGACHECVSKDMAVTR